MDNSTAERLPDRMDFHGIREGPSFVAFPAVDGVKFLEYHPLDFERELMNLCHGVGVNRFAIWTVGEGNNATEARQMTM